ncbi:ATP-dependent zinc metalloprotease FtsH, partial [bacterium]|nr:ATP-dependent zinc metalloprotease FtsH [bacterium]
MSPKFRQLFIFLFIAIMLLTIMNWLNPEQVHKEIKYSEFVNAVKAGQIASVTIKGSNISGQLKPGVKLIPQEGEKGIFVLDPKSYVPVTASTPAPAAATDGQTPAPQTSDSQTSDSQASGNQLPNQQTPDQQTAGQQTPAPGQQTPAAQSSPTSSKPADGQKAELFKTVFRNSVTPSPEAFLLDSGVSTEVLDNDGTDWWFILVQVIPTLLLLVIMFTILRQTSNSQAFSFGRSRHKAVSDSHAKVTFEDVAGVEEAKEELAEVVDYLKFPNKYKALGARIPKGVLLLGSPGTGKTLLGRAVAGEADVPFFYISGSDFVEMFVGVGASRVRDLFEQAKKNAPCIVFMDEIDAVGRQRGAGLGGGHDEREQTLNQLLVEMDGFDASPTAATVVVLAATNRPDVLDPALLRPGRFDRQVTVDRPDISGRLAILKVHSRGKPLDSDIDLKELAQRTSGFSGADLENLLNEAALLAARNNREAVTMADCTEAIDRIMMGPERKSRIIALKDREITAYHEAGHALVARALPHADPVRKITILPRGQALGVTSIAPDSDRYNMTRNQLLASITVFMGGRVAEEIIFKDVTTGASNDIERATELARDLVCRYGMNDRIGPLHYGRKQSQVFLGRDIVENKNCSEKTAQIIDEEIHKTVTECYDMAKDILTTNIDQLHRLCEMLIEKEVVEAAELTEEFGPAARDLLEDEDSDSEGANGSKAEGAHIFGGSKYDSDGDDDEDEDEDED